MAEAIAGQQDIFIVDVEIKQEDMNVVWVLLDSEKGGVNVDLCSKISRDLAFQIDEEQIMKGSYRLNVSSPGLSRPLSDKRQYKKNTGRTVKVKYKQNDEYEQLEGNLADVTDEYITVDSGKDKPARIEFSDVVETKIIPKI